MSSRQVVLTLPADPAATEVLGCRLGRHLRPGDTVALSGSLGAGKTTLVRGLAVGLEVDDPDAVASPTYLLVVEHPGPVPLLHADAYLPQKLEGFLADGGLEYLFDAAHVVAVEWADRIPNQLPERTLWIEIGLSPDGGRRVVLRTGAKPPAFSWLEDLPTMSTGR
ncbi:MAG: tRNA (adenosine(37)-N6)-threonylcarbamoyltransferase complex ATPase subunit type 1 TsaE [Planctomycetes bacterium]|nr:tRNA (adenosine(37)-N6)-threonylcarbamoyltransferase complex ATPase subunit type 1 TsaE [Planctomycetota bacterium]